jgi:hypothetical protein
MDRVGSKLLARRKLAELRAANADLSECRMDKSANRTPAGHASRRHFTRSQQPRSGSEGIPPEASNHGPVQNQGIVARAWSDE